MALCGALSLAASEADLKVGMIGLETSHVVEYTRRLNDVKDNDYIPGAHVAVAFKGGSRDIPASWNRLEGFTKTMREKYQVKIVDSIDALLAEAADESKRQGGAPVKISDVMAKNGGEMK